jgi:flagellar biosynthesis GTPase FlhF
VLVYIWKYTTFNTKILKPPSKFATHNFISKRTLRHLENHLFKLNIKLTAMISILMVQDIGSTLLASNKHPTDRIALVGNAGVGKTCLVRRFKQVKGTELTK